MFPLKKKQKYLVKRIGHSSDRVTCGRTYIASYECIYDGGAVDKQYGWLIKKTNKPNTQTQPSLKPNSSVWEVLYPCDEYGQPLENTTESTEEKTMSEAFESITTGCIINKKDAKKFSDAEIIGFIVTQRERFEDLKDKVGEDSKYFKAKSAEIAESIADLTIELDSRA